jgi:hypothetical protein
MILSEIPRASPTIVAPNYPNEPDASGVKLSFPKFNAYAAAPLFA